MFATHYLEEAQNFAQRIVLIAKGRIIADGSVDEVRRLTNHRRLTAQLPPGRAENLVAELRPFLGDDASLDGTCLNTTVIESDALALALLERGAWDLTVTAANLEEAFFTLTETERQP